MSKECKTRGRPKIINPRNNAVLIKFNDKEYRKLQLLADYYDMSLQEVIRFVVDDAYNIVF
jgi:hypothetical protein